MPRLPGRLGRLDPSLRPQAAAIAALVVALILAEGLIFVTAAQDARTSEQITHLDHAVVIPISERDPAHQIVADQRIVRIRQAPGHVGVIEEHEPAHRAPVDHALRLVAH